MEHKKTIFWGKQKKKSRKNKIKVVWLHWEWSEIDGRQEMKGESRRQISMGYDSEGGTGWNTRTVRQWQRRWCMPFYLAVPYVKMNACWLYWNWDFKRCCNVADRRSNYISNSVTHYHPSSANDYSGGQEATCFFDPHISLSCSQQPTTELYPPVSWIYHNFSTQHSQDTLSYHSHIDI